MKIALVHDQLNEFGGAERVLLAMSEIWPQAPIYTAYCKKGSPAWERFKDRDIRVSWIQPLARFASPLRFLAPLVWNSFSAKGGSAWGGNFSQYDVILSSASWYITKGFGTRGTGRTKPIEICYCHTPPRWLYGYPTSVNWQRYQMVRWYATIVGFFMRQYDFRAAQKVDYFIANSKETQKRIRKFYRREPVVIYPPIDLPKIPKVKRGNYYLFVSRPVGSKGLDSAISAAKKLGIPLKIVGTKGNTENNIEYFGHVSDAELAGLYAGAKAFLAPATDEDFGMTPVEAMAAGTPVIAYAGGGYRESVVDGKTGIFFHEPTAESLIAAIKKFEKINIDAKDCIAQAKKFSKERFKTELISFIDAHSV